MKLMARSPRRIQVAAPDSFLHGAGQQVHVGKNERRWRRERGRWIGYFVTGTQEIE
jgi:hypothetical protein